MTHHTYPHPVAFDMAIQRPVFAMMQRGIRVDEKRRLEMAEQRHTDWDDYQRKLDQVVGQHLNVGSAPQMQRFFYDELKLPPRRKKNKLTTDEDALRALMAICEDKLNSLLRRDAKERWLRGFIAIKLVLKIRSVRKELSSYLGCPPSCGCKKPSIVGIDPDGHMRSTITVGGTETGRFSHSKTLWGTGCNLATIPRGLRTMFIADEGKELAEFDLNRGESWVYAYLSLDPELVRIHSSFGDFHSETASAIATVFSPKPLTVEEVIRLYKSGDQFGYKLRYLGKKVNHASAYRMGPFRGSEVINEEADDTGITITVAQMKKAQDLWKQKYFGIQTWWDSVDTQLESTRELVTPWGRRRKFYGFMGDHLKKEATAYVPQSTSVDYLNLGMLKVFEELDQRGAFGLELLHQNHDSILIQYDADRRAEVMPAVIECLTGSVRINGHDVTIPIEGSYGPSWKELTEWK